MTVPKSSISGMRRYEVVCSGCKAKLAMLTAFGDVSITLARGHKANTGFFTIELSSCARCSDADKRKEIEFELASKLLGMIQGEASIQDLKRYLSTKAPASKDYTQNTYPVRPGEPPSLPEMAEHSGLFPMLKKKKIRRAVKKS